MDSIKWKKIISFLLISIGAILLIIEIGAAQKNYYYQSAGVVCLMTGVFLVNTTVASKSKENTMVNEVTNEEE